MKWVRQIDRELDFEKQGATRLLSAAANRSSPSSWSPKPQGQGFQPPVAATKGASNSPTQHPPSAPTGSTRGRDMHVTCHRQMLGNTVVWESVTVAVSLLDHSMFVQNLP